MLMILILAVLSFICVKLVKGMECLPLVTFQMHLVISLNLELLMQEFVIMTLVLADEGEMDIGICHTRVAVILFTVAMGKI